MTDRKKEHIDFTNQAQIDKNELDNRFVYEPLQSTHPVFDFKKKPFAGKNIRFPLWASSMTGGTDMAFEINSRIARVCSHFGMGMGLGSCRKILTDNTHLKDFRLRKYIGDYYPLYANLGIAQIEHIIEERRFDLIYELIDKTETDGLIVHINPIQEFIQPEGDKILLKPIEALRILLDNVDFPIIVKEVGQGFGPESLKALLQLPIEAIELAGFGGTNFPMLEILRSQSYYADFLRPLAMVGHTVYEMLDFINDFYINSSDDKIKCRQLILSGGVRHFLDGYYLVSKSKFNAVYGQAQQLLKHAQISYDHLHEYVRSQHDGYLMAVNYLRIKE